MTYNISHILKSCAINGARYYRIEIPETDLRNITEHSGIDNSVVFNDEVSVSLTKTESNDSVMFSINLQLIHRRERAGVLASEMAVEFSLNLPETEKVLGNTHSNTWWMAPQFAKNFDELSTRTQGALLKCGEEYICLLPLNGDNCYCEIGEGKVYISVGSLEYDKLSGPFLCVSKGNDPFKTVSNAYHYAREKGGIKGKLIEEKEWPDQLKGLGICTWNMCYKELTSGKIYRKLDELREKKVPVQWFLFDNGWLQIKDRSLVSFKENRDNIPEGLKECIRRIKQDYGIKYVGVWHTFNGYEMGICPDSELYKDQKENLETMPGGTVELCADETKIFSFWNSWHSYLEECGVDFIKVDSQSTYPILCEGRKSNIEYTRSNQNALEQSAKTHFDGAVLNCMGMDMQNVLERESSISRTSGDFDPSGNPERFYKHILQDVWTSIWHGAMYYGDFDMFWSAPGNFLKHESVLRAISGGPVYLSDEIGSTVYDNLRPCINEDGSLPTMEHSALPTKDIIFEDCYLKNRLVKIWNEKNGNYALMLLTRSPVKDERVNLDCIPGINHETEYMVYEYFSGSKQIMKGSDFFMATLNPDEVRAYSVMPIKNGKYDFIDVKLFFPFAGKLPE